MSVHLSAEQFITRLESYSSPDAIDTIRRAIATGAGDERDGDLELGVRHGQIVALAKAFIEMPIDEIDRLLDSPIYEVRVGALSIMGKQAARKRTPEQHKHALFDLYLRRTDRINSWQLVDMSCHYVVGGYLLDKPRDVLYQLARSPH